MPYRDGKNAPLIDALDGIGSDIRHHECPRCGSHDRERHLFLYMQAAGILAGLRDMRILHFAPEKRLSRVFSQQTPKYYVRCDLYPQEADVQKVNIQSMPFSDASFDLVIANHVLEHVEDELQAAREIHRVLAPSGYAILQTPYSPMLHHTWHDPGIVSEQARLQAYGQEDHARLFGRDIFERIASGGLTPNIGSHDQLLPTTDAATFGVNRKEPFFLFHRSN